MLPLCHGWSMHSLSLWDGNSNILHLLFDSLLDFILHLIIALDIFGQEGNIMSLVLNYSWNLVLPPIVILWKAVLLGISQCAL